jgi:hypothetical protein
MLAVPWTHKKNVAIRVHTHVGFEVDKVVWGSFSPSTSVSPGNSHFINGYVFINHPIIDAKSHAVASLNNRLKTRNSGKN